MTSSTAEGQSQSSELPIQALRQRVHQLVDTVHTVQQRCDELTRQDAAARTQRHALSEQLTALTQEREQISAQRQELAAKLEALSGQCNDLQRQRDTLTAERDTLQAERDALSAQRDELQQDRDRLSAKRDSLRAERDSLLEEKIRLDTDNRQLKAALEHVFPYETYKEKRADLKQFDRGQLMDHFVLRGINENTDLRHAPMKKHLEACQNENRQLHKEASLIQQELSKAQIHMELLKELITASNS